MIEIRIPKEIKGNTAQLTKYCHQKRETQRSS